MVSASPLRPTILAPFVAALLLLPGCDGDGSAPRAPGAAGDPYASAAIPPLTPRELAAGRFPAGFRIGDQVADQRWVPVDQQRSERSPGVFERIHGRPDPLYRLVAAGRSDAQGAAGAKAQVVQAIYPDRLQLRLADFAAQAGVVPGPVAAFMAVPECRDRMRMSQDHVARLREPALLIGTDRRGTYLLLRGERVDSVVIAPDLAAIDLIEGRSLAAETARLRAAVAAGDLAAIPSGLWEQAVALPHGEPIAAEWASHQERIAQLREEQLRADQAHDAPLLAAADARLAVLRAAMAGGEAGGRIDAWLVGMGELKALLKGLRRGVWPGWAECRSLLAAEAGRRAAASPASADGLLSGRFAVASAVPGTDKVQECYARAAVVDGAATYAEAYAAWRSLVEAKGAPGEPWPWRALLATAAQRESDAQAATGRSGPAGYLAAVAADLRRRYTVGDISWEPAPEAVAATARQLEGLPPAGSDQRLAWIADQRVDFNRQDWRIFSGYHAQLLREAAAAVDSRADGFESRGLPATAAALRFAVLMHLRDEAASPIALHAVADVPAGDRRGRALRALEPVLAGLWPRPDAATAYGQRLVELLAEGERLQWPLVRCCQLVVEVRPAGEFPDRHLHLIEEGQAARLELRERAQPVAAGFEWVGFYANLGVSQETMTESLALRKESEVIDAEKKAVRAGFDGLDARKPQLEDLKQRITALASRIDNASVDEHNRLVRERNAISTTFNSDLQGLNKRQGDLKQRIAAYNPRVQANNERRSRETSAERLALDARLLGALDGWFAAALADRERRLRAELPAGPELEQEIRLGRWLVGRDAGGPVLPRAEPTAYAILQSAALERQLGTVAEFERRMDILLDWWGWSGKARMDAAKRTDFMRQRISDYARRSSIDMIRRRIAGRAGLAAQDATQFGQWIDAVQEELRR